MAGIYLRELFYQYVEELLPAVQRADIDQNITYLLKTEQIKPVHVVLAKLYCSGYSLLELEQIVPAVEEKLIHFFSLLSETMRYNDEIVLNIWLNNNSGNAKEQRYKRIQKLKIVDAWRDKIEQMSRNFSDNIADIREELH